MRTTKVEKIAERETGVVRITRTEADGSETVINVDEDVHYVFAYIKVSEKRGVELPLETLVKGSTNVCGEMLYQILEANRPLIEHCRKRAIEKGLKELKAKGIDIGAEAFRNAPVVGGVQ